MVERVGDRTHQVDLQRGAEDAHGGQHPGAGGDDDRVHLQRVGQGARVQRTGPAEGDQREPPGIDTALHRHDPQGLLHGGIHHPDDAIGTHAGPPQGRPGGLHVEGAQPGNAAPAGMRPAARSASVTVGSTPPRP